MHVCIFIFDSLSLSPSLPPSLSPFLFPPFLPLSCSPSLSNSREVTTLMDLINAQLHMSEWQLLPAVVALQSAHTKLSNWLGIFPLGNHVRTYMYIMCVREWCYGACVLCTCMSSFFLFLFLMCTVVLYTSDYSCTYVY